MKTLGVFIRKTGIRWAFATAAIFAIAVPHAIADEPPTRESIAVFFDFPDSTAEMSAQKRQVLFTRAIERTAALSKEGSISEMDYISIIGMWKKYFNLERLDVEGVNPRTFRINREDVLHREYLEARRKLPLPTGTNIREHSRFFFAVHELVEIRYIVIHQILEKEFSDFKVDELLSGTNFSIAQTRLMMDWLDSREHGAVSATFTKEFYDNLLLLFPPGKTVAYDFDRFEPKPADENFFKQTPFLGDVIKNLSARGYDFSLLRFVDRGTVPADREQVVQGILGEWLNLAFYLSAINKGFLGPEQFYTQIAFKLFGMNIAETEIPRRIGELLRVPGKSDSKTTPSAAVAFLLMLQTELQETLNKSHGIHAVEASRIYIGIRNGFFGMIARRNPDLYAYLKGIHHYYFHRYILGEKIDPPSGFKDYQDRSWEDLIYGDILLENHVFAAWNRVGPFALPPPPKPRIVIDPNPEILESEKVVVYQKTNPWAVESSLEYSKAFMPTELGKWIERTRNGRYDGRPASSLLLQHLLNEMEVTWVDGRHFVDFSQKDVGICEIYLLPASKFLKYLKPFGSPQ